MGRVETGKQGKEQKRPRARQEPSRQECTHAPDAQAPKQRLQRSNGADARFLRTHLGK